MKNLIVNADDFGLSKAVTDAICDSHINGIVTSTTIMVNMPGFDYAANLSKKYPKLGIGLHITLTQGKPISSPESVNLLINENGEFFDNLKQRKNLFFFNSKKYHQLKVEISAQFKKATDTGIRITHFDSHHHITGLPMASLAALTAAKLFGVKKARITSVKYWNVNFVKYLRAYPKELFHGINSTILHSQGMITPDYKILPHRVFPLQFDFTKQFMQALKVIPDNKTVEIALHPGYDDPDLIQKKETKDIRKRDYDIATNLEVIDYIKLKEIKLIIYDEL